MTNQNTNEFEQFEEQDSKPIDWKNLLMQYLVYWPWIAGCVLAALVLCYVYLRYQAPVYNVTASVLIKEGENAKSGSSDMMETMQNIGMFSVASNFDNELEVLRSRDLNRKVVKDLSLYITYREPHTFGYDRDLYKAAPVQVWLTPEEAEKLKGSLRIRYDYNPQRPVTVRAMYTDPASGKEAEAEKTIPSFPAVWTLPVGALTLNRDSAYAGKAVTVEATIASPSRTAAAYASMLSVEATSKTTSIAQLSLSNTSVERARDYLTRLVAIYNSDTNEDKNEVAARTAEFIDERIRIINAELGTTEQELADFKQQAGLTNLSADAELALKENSAYSQKQAENATQIRLVEFLRSYINDPGNAWEVIPSNVGLTDDNLSAQIDKYNQLLIERKRLLRTSSENNPAVVTLDESIRAMRANVVTTVESVEKGLQITRADLNRQAEKYSSRISNAPRQEKQLISISRQQEIKANLYLMLLQKREENAITLAAIANNGRIINTPMAAPGPIAPKSKTFYLVAVLLGIAVPVSVIYTRNLFRYRIESRADVEAITSLPIVGDVPYVKGMDEHPIVVRENRNDLMEEVYRSVRTNILYMLQPGQKVILFTSTMNGEGKSSNIGNVAASLAFMDKKVVVVGLDIRKPGLNKIFGLSSREQGFTQYLSDPTIDLLSLCRPSGVSDNLYVLPGGPIPPNPTELVSRQALDDAINLLKQHFDYVLLDTAPIGMVADTQLITRVADMSVYICRSEYTHKSDFTLINELVRDKKLPNPCVLINALNMDSRTNGYYYGLGKYGKYSRYGYGKKYGYGYGKYENIKK